MINKLQFYGLLTKLMWQQKWEELCKEHDEKLKKNED